MKEITLPVAELKPALVGLGNQKREKTMPTRNTPILRQIIKALDVRSPEVALAHLERVFKDKLLIVAGDLATIEAQAQELRLAITTAEAGKVLDHIGEHHMAQISIDTTEEVINLLYPDRFVEP